MGDYGLAFSQRGYDVKTCADRYLVYSSAFQTLKIHIAATASTTIPRYDEPDRVIPIYHNLGYLTPFLVVYNGSSRIGLGRSYIGNDAEAQINALMYTNRLDIVVSSDFNYYSFNNDGTSSQEGDTVYFTAYIFLNGFNEIPQRDINQSVISGGSSSDYGFRISKPGFDVKTCTDDQCIAGSSFFNAIVHKQGAYYNGTDQAQEIEIVHNAGYIPHFFSYWKDQNTDYIYTSRGAVDEWKLYLYLEPYQTAYYTIIKSKLN